jgi:hypothetical protein
MSLILQILGFAIFIALGFEEMADALRDMATAIDG